MADGGARLTADGRPWIADRLIESLADVLAITVGRTTISQGNPPRPGTPRP
ncbi:hypothetical protein AB0H86_04525 [Streptomyces sp. NPDC050997]|uniref:hypothetical protein n=1 Tax=Streptomyces sp. NPDC050997 TaxID=3155519 RepID=UPI003444F6BF